MWEGGGRRNIRTNDCMKYNVLHIIGLLPSSLKFVFRIQRISLNSNLIPYIIMTYCTAE